MKYLKRFNESEENLNSELSKETSSSISDVSGSYIHLDLPLEYEYIRRIRYRDRDDYNHIMFHLRIKLLDEYNINTGGFDYKHLHPVLWDALSMYNKSKERFDGMNNKTFFKLYKDYKSNLD